MTGRYPEELKDLVNENLRRYFPRVDKEAAPVGEAMSYALFAPGKRFRPILTLLAAESVGGEINTAMPTACAFEFIHAYSLVHDDLPALDDDDVRRGQPTCHKKFGEDVAILAGDALCTAAFTLVAEEQGRLSADTLVVEVIAEMGRAAGVNGMIGGQTADITSTGRDINENSLTYIHSRKTGSLIKGAAVCGAILGGADKKQIARITDFAVHLGFTFQIIDDILDVVGSAPGIGRPAGSDEKQKKTTFASKMGVEDSIKAARDQIDKAKTALDGTALKQDRLIDLAEFVITRSY